MASQTVIAESEPVPGVVDADARLGKLGQRTITASVVNILRAAILDGRFPPGAQLREVAIANELGVSRAPLREALTVLAESGLVSRIPFRGSFVATVSSQQIAEIASLRNKLEPMAIELAIPHLGKRQLRALTDDVETMQAAADEGDMAKSIDAHMGFHRRLYEYSQHDLLLSIWLSWEAQLQLFLSLDHQAFEDLHELAAAHLRLLDAVLTKDMAIITDEVALHIHGADSNASDTEGASA